MTQQKRDQNNKGQKNWMRKRRYNQHDPAKKIPKDSVEQKRKTVPTTNYSQNRTQIITKKDNPLVIKYM